MSALSVRLPESLHNRVKHLSIKDRVSINQFVASAVAEKISAIETVEYIHTRAQRASRKKFLSAMATVPDAEPAKGEE